MRRSPSRAVVAAALSMSAACSSGHENQHKQITPSPEITRAVGASALNLLASKRQQIEQGIRAGKITQAEVISGLCTAIEQDGTVYGIPNPLYISVDSPIHGKTLGQLGGYDSVTRQIVFGAVTEVSADGSRSIELPGFNREINLFYDGLESDVSHVDLIANSGDKFYDPLGNQVATVATTATDISLRNFAESAAFKDDCDMAIKNMKFTN